MKKLVKTFVVEVYEITPTKVEINQEIRDNLAKTVSLSEEEKLRERLKFLIDEREQIRLQKQKEYNERLKN